MEVRERYINFYTDYAFKKLFGTAANKDLLIDFLNALFNGQECITDLSYLNSEQLGGTESDRKAFFDVYCTNDQGDHFIVEMQQNSQKHFIDRTLYYTSFDVNQQGEQGEWDYRLNKLYVISILNFVFDHKNPEYFHHEVLLMDKNLKEVFYDKWKLIYLEMPKFTKKEDELETQFEKWLYAIGNLYRLEERPASLKGEIFRRLFEQAEVTKFTRTERMQYILSRKQMWDEYSKMKSQLEKGREEGEAIGLGKGRLLERLQMARKLKAMDTPLETIVQVTGLTEEEIK